MSRTPLQRRFDEALTHQKAGRFERAGAIYDELLRRAPRMAAVHAMKGLLALQTGRKDEALASFDAALALDDSVAGTHLNRGNALRALGRPEDAAAAYERALALDPRASMAHNNLGNLLRDQGHLQGAAAAYRSALALDPHLFAAAANLAQVLTRLDELPRGQLIAAHRDAIAAAAARETAGVDLANVHNTLGNLLLAEEAVDEAIVHYRQALALDPQFANAYLNLAGAYARAGGVEDSITALREGRARWPDDLRFFKPLAMQLRRADRGGEALEVYRAWHDLDPDDPIAAHMAQATDGQPPPARASDDYVRREFDGFAANFDAILAKLEYRAPALVAEALNRHLPAAAGPLDVLDAGCGTGLCAPFLRPRARRLAGIDLSAKMLELARQRGGYDELIEGEIVAYVEAHPGAHDLVVAADVFCYFGDLERAMNGLRGTLRPGGWLALTVEAAEDERHGYVLRGSGRYAHHEGYLRRTLASAGFHVLEMTRERLRRELAAEITGLLIVARVPAAD